MNKKQLFFLIPLVMSTCLYGVEYLTGAKDVNYQFMEAAKKGSAPELKALLAKGANVNVRNQNDDSTALHHASISSNPEHDKAIKVLIAAGADVDARTKKGKTALHWAATRKHGVCAEDLIEGGAPIDDTDQDGNTALHIAAAGGNIEVVKVLLNKNANPMLFNNDDKTPRDLAESAGHTAIVELLDQAEEKAEEALGEPKELKFLTGEKDVNYRFIEAAKRGSAKELKALLAQGADVDVLDKDYNTALHYAAFTGNTDAVEVLLAADALTDTINLRSESPLHVAAKAGHTDVVIKLTEARETKD